MLNSDTGYCKSFKKAVSHINNEGFLLTFPIKNSNFPNSLWNMLHPNQEMIWEWTDESDNKVAELWHLRKQLAESRQVIYGKYFRGRATFFSKSVFQDLMTIQQTSSISLSFNDSRNILDALELDSPLSTKQLKEITELKGRLCEPLYNKALKTLWENFLIVAIGEIADGAFPSLAHGSTKIVFEDLWLQSQKTELADAWLRLCELKEFELLEKSLFCRK
jgi:hypothetical protein